MNVWIINLKDNSGDGSKKNTPYKFEFCKDKSIIGIGWCDEKYVNDNDYNSAKECLDKMQQGAFVWTRHPVSKEYYLCKILDKTTIELDLNDPKNQKYTDNDISAYRKVKFHRINCNVKSLIDYKKLISRSTARAVFDAKTIKLTEDIITREGIK